MSHSLLELAYQLTRDEEPFVLATVVWCERPTSAKPGAQALIQSDGRLTGWIGGSCAQPVVVREATRLLREGGASFLLRLGSPEIGIDRRNVRIFPMTCTSGGALDIYMEPHLPLPRLLLVGDSPVNVALSRLAPVLDFAVAQFDQDALAQTAINERTYILVATHGEYDEDALEHALRSSAAYVGMVASRRRADACRNYLRGSGLTEEQIARLKAPAGLDIGAITPEEIASSILSELVQVRRNISASTPATTVPEGKLPASEELAPAASGTALDPVCGMIVEIAHARHRSSYDGRDFYFCCPACKRLFESNPQEYLVRNEG
ncbi:MAG TPA: XdhC family protein [Ktedonobacteraceae bacterium]|nr:XdhC family protein [Ktedonobacteraceae bacterium]